MTRPIYFAGPLFTTAEREFNAKVVDVLRTKWAYAVFLPQEHEGKSIGTAKSIFDVDVAGLKTAGVVVASMDGSDPDSGTCWEVGFAYASNKPVILWRTDIREEKLPLGPVNLMMHARADAVLTMPLATAWSVAHAIHKAIMELGQ